MKLQLTLDGHEIALASGHYPDGAVWLKLLPPFLSHAHTVRIRATAMRSMDDVMLLAQLVDAVRQRFNIRHSVLELPWLPYARQDRLMGEGDSFALKVFAGFINQLAFDRVLVLDPHSDVAAGVINNMVAIPQYQCLMQSAALLAELQQGMLLMAPDAGALKKIHELAQRTGVGEYGILGKHRDLSTGALSGFELLKGDVAGRAVLIADDLCDAGGTFIGSAAVLRQAGARSVSLYVTHGLFTKGTAHLFEQGIDRIWTTTSVAGPSLAQAGVELIDIEDIYHAQGIQQC